MASVVQSVCEASGVSRTSWPPVKQKSSPKVVDCHMELMGKGGVVGGLEGCDP